MNLLKFNLLFVPLLALLLGTVTYFSRSLLRENATQQITQNARIMLETATSSRTYTTKQVAPLLQHKNFKLQAAIEEFKKALDELPKSLDTARLNEVYDRLAKEEAEAKVRARSAAEAAAAMAAAMEPAPAPPSPNDAATATPVSEEKPHEAIVPTVAQSPAATPSETDARKAPRFWQRLFRSDSKDTAGSAPKEAPPSAVPAEAPAPKPVEVAPSPKSNAPALALSGSAAATTSLQLPAALKPAATPAPPVAAPSASEAFLLGRQRVLEEQKKYIDTVRSKPDEMLDREFHPQSVPAYAATEIFGYLRMKYPDYFYKEATLNPSNLRDRTTDWEADIVNNFRGNSTLTEFIGTRNTPTGAALYLARPIKVTNVSCLTCHSTPDKAPPEMIKLYGSANGFGWKMDEIIGAQIISMPMSLPLSMADQAWKRLARWMGAAFAGIVLAGNLGFGVVIWRRKADELETEDASDDFEAR
jgi:hypothetical protein